MPPMRTGAKPLARVHGEVETKLGPFDADHVFDGSARTGAGVDALMRGIVRLLPASSGDAEGPVSGTVFKIERGPAGEKIAYVRMFAGTLRARDRVRFGAGR